MPSDKPMTLQMQNKNNIHDEKDKNIYYPNALVSVPKHSGTEQKKLQTIAQAKATWASLHYHPLNEPCAASSIMRDGTILSATIPISDGDIGFCRMRSSRIISPISKPTPCYAQTSPSYVPCFVSMARTHYSLPYLPIMSDPTKY